MRRSMTYGTLPTLAEFRAAFAAMVVPDGRGYEVRAGASGLFLGTAHSMAFGDRASFSVEQLFALVGTLTDMWVEGNERAGDEASSILETLGFEWI